MNQVTKNLAHCIETCGKTQTQVAFEFGVHFTTISDYKKGKAFPKLYRFPELCRILNCNYEDVLGKLD